MELDDAHSDGGPSRPNDILAALLAEDIDRLSRAELEARIAGLEREIVRIRARIAHVADQRASADQLFRR